MVLALEEGYDRSSWWLCGLSRARRSGQEVQPLFCMKGEWDLCTCEGGDEWTTHCPTDYPSFRYDWRPGRELTEEQATQWALNQSDVSAHHIFNGTGVQDVVDTTDTVPSPTRIDTRIELEYIDVAVDPERVRRLRVVCITSGGFFRYGRRSG